MNDQNLTPFTSKSGKEAGRKGGIASAEAKRKRKLINQLFIDRFFGNIPNGYHVVFLDGNENNFDPKNICCVTEETHKTMKLNHWYSNDPDNTLTAIKLCELSNLVKGGKKCKTAKKRKDFIKSEFVKEICFLSKKFSFLENDFPEVFQAISNVLEKGTNNE